MIGSPVPNLSFLNVRMDMDSLERELMEAGGYDIGVTTSDPISSFLGTSAEVTLAWSVSGVERPLVATGVAHIGREDMLKFDDDDQLIAAMQSRLQTTIISLLRQAVDVTKDYDKGATQ